MRPDRSCARAPYQLLGIDEAGRGPVLGPLVLCGVRASEGQLVALERLGVRDSKGFGSGAAGRKARAALAAAVRAHSHAEVRIAQAERVDRAVAGPGGLNALECTLAREIISAGPPPSRIIADGRQVFGPLAAEFPYFEARDRADESELIVSAASIVAKHVRDRAMAELYAPFEEDFGPIGGGGYPNAATARFLRSFFDRRHSLPPGLRLTWRWAVLLELRSMVTAAVQR